MMRVRCPLALLAVPAVAAVPTPHVRPAEQECSRQTAPESGERRVPEYTPQKDMNCSLVEM